MVLTSVFFVLKIVLCSSQISDTDFLKDKQTNIQKSQKIITLCTSIFED